MTMKYLKKELKQFLLDKNIPLTTISEGGFTFGRMSIRKTTSRGVYITYEIKEHYEAVENAVKEFFNEKGCNAIKSINQKEYLVMTLSAYDSRMVVK